MALIKITRFNSQNEDPILVDGEDKGNGIFVLSEPLCLTKGKYTVCAFDYVSDDHCKKTAHIEVERKQTFQVLEIL